MTRYIVTSGCELEINAILDYIADDNIDAAILFYDSLVNKFQKISDNPSIGRERPELSEGLRSSQFGNYIVFYRIWADQVAIVRVIHGARDLDQQFKD